MTALPRDVVTELYVAGSWVDVTSDVYTRDAIGITRGRRDEGSRPQPSACSITLDNRTGKYSPRNPEGIYYGSIGRNTPVRVALRRITDEFARTETDQWGVTPGGHVWSHGAGLGNVADSDWYVTGGEAVHEVNDRSAYRLSYLGTVTYRDVDVAVTVRLDIVDVLGDDIEPGCIMVRGQSTTDYLQCRVTAQTDESITIDLRHFDDEIIAGPVAVPELSPAPSGNFRVRMQAEGQTLRAKVWTEGGDEPYGWHVTGHTDRNAAAGWVGVRSGVAVGNTNTLPVVFRYDDWVVSVPRFAGEVSSWPQRRHSSGNDQWVPIVAAGIMRRLGQGSSLVESPLRRGLLSDEITQPVAYWPCEDLPGAASIAPAVGAVALFLTGTPEFSSNEDFAASAPLPQLRGSVWYAPIPAHDRVDERTQVRFLLSVPESGVDADTIVCEIGSTGDVERWRVLLNANGSLALQAFNHSGTELFDSGFLTYAVNGSPRWISVEWQQAGADLEEVNLVTLEPGGGALQLPVHTIAGATAGIPTWVLVNTAGALDDTAVGHVSVHREWSSLFALDDQLAAWSGETAGARVQRLCAENAIPFCHAGDLDATTAMGPQPSGTLLDVLRECADADVGTLHEPRGELGICYRTRTSLYNQAATLSLDFAARQVWPPLEPTDDDQQVVNDVTVNRSGGGSARAVDETGPLSVLPAAEGGVGRYEHSETLNLETDEQLPDLAGWLLHLGTVAETRYPKITVNLASEAADPIETDALDLSIDDRVTVMNLPATLDPDPVSQIARGYAELINLYEHRLVLNCAPESPYRVLELGADDARLDSDASTLDTAVTSSDTSLSVAVADDTLWTTDAAELPLDIVVGGEQITVTAVSGTSSPQTFTVTRSVNGVSKSHAAGAAVHVADPVYLGL